MSWKLTGGSEKSDNELNRLAHTFQAKDFNLDDLKGFNAHTQTKIMDAAEEAEMEGTLDQDGWQTTTVTIDVPTRDRCPQGPGNGKPFSISGFRYCSLTGVIRTVFCEAASKWFHLTPFKRVWKSPVTGKEQRLYDELYSSDAWNAEHDKLQKQTRSDGCKLEKVITGLMFWLDATQLAQFGHAKAWPIYMFFGNQSKYRRASPNTGPCHPVAFIPSVRIQNLTCASLIMLC